MINLSISPPQLEIVLKPGATFTQAYQITNNSDQTVFLSTSIKPWRPTDTVGSLAYDNSIPPNPHLHFSLANANLKLNQTFRLPPHTARQLVLKIKADPNAALQDSYYTLFISQDPSATLSQSPQNLVQIGSHLLLSVSATASPQIKSSFSSFSASPLIKDSLLTPISLTAQINNLSNYFFKSSGNLTISKNQQIIKQLNLYPHNVLAHHSRQISCSTSDTPPRPRVCTLSPPFWPGKYTATLNLSYDNHTNSASISFYVFPFPLLFPILFILLLIFVKKIRLRSP